MARVRRLSTAEHARANLARVAGEISRSERSEMSAARGTYKRAASMIEVAAIQEQQAARGDCRGVDE